MEIIIQTVLIQKDVFGFGYNKCGQLGLGCVDDKYIAQQVPDVVQIKHFTWIV